MKIYNTDNKYHRFIPTGIDSSLRETRKGFMSNLNYSFMYRHDETILWLFDLRVCDEDHLDELDDEVIW